jgi:hypothetical protein
LGIKSRAEVKVVILGGTPAVVGALGGSHGSL